MISLTVTLMPVTLKAMQQPVRDTQNLLSQVKSPSDLRRFTPAQLVKLSREIRAFLINAVSETGGHMGPNLGVVELTIALHRIYESPKDAIIWDTGHQAYVHKLLTGRQDFSNLRGRGGLSGYPSRAESVHDVVENSHASTALSWADGIERERGRIGQEGFVVAVIGDGALTGGMAWEALNNIAAPPARPLTIVVNDNGRSYDRTVGGVAHHLSTLRTSEGYERALAWGKKTLFSLGEPGRAAFDALHGLKAGLKDIFVPQAMFEELGYKYVGPIPGHDIVALEQALDMAKNYGAPVIVHVITEKGRGYTPAEDNKADHFHAVGRIHPETGLPVVPEKFGWTSVFAEEIVSLAKADSRIVGVTAAMKAPVGLAPLSDKYPERVVDVGIAEQHAVTMAAGMAFAGAHPVFAVYATFLNRAFDQLLMDVSLHHAPVTFILDRAGITGNDGASHNGMWDLSLASMVPGLKVAAPRDGQRLRELLKEAVSWQAGPTLVRYPKGALPPDLPAVSSTEYGDFLVKAAGAKSLIVAVGPFAHLAVEAATQVGGVDVVDPRWVLPVDSGIVQLAREYKRVIVLEDGVVTGGVGAQLARLVPEISVEVMGVPAEFLAQSERAQILRDIGLTTESLVSLL
jgi:1-deoxy-D-xylulose-5-phosphate synthase